ncbi:DUF2225 domain-containing protein [Clostridium sp. P21]|uniref:DUF2225 domain-containing protein n=1 Tax=Clostridium muellerianum TaxID=2716538 RepID=A0A7Y0HNE4_9CLOT|nr:DUF2225 domain-containing protein [Clostridium muellerianum]NMM61518.1 DUF2225 domain-containing protein [Clostridium muellerianum]
MSKSIFSGLEDLGFDDIDEIDLYNTKKKEIKKEELLELTDEEKEIKLLYDREITCPVCDNVFKAKAVKTSAARMSGRDSDSFIRYDVINPYFYDVWICNKCGYSAMKSDFNKLRGYQIDLVKEKIQPKWRPKNYPDVYNVNIAIERFKLSLLNYYVTDSKPSKKAMNCLKLAWMYRLLKDTENESMFLKQALEGFNSAFFNEAFPLYNMDKFTSMYIIGELNRRLGNNDEGSKWFSQLITTYGVPSKLKDRSRDQRDLIKEAQELEKGVDKLNNVNSSEKQNTKEKKGFFSRFFS